MRSFLYGLMKEHVCHGYHIIAHSNACTHPSDLLYYSTICEIYIHEILKQTERKLGIISIGRENPYIYINFIDTLIEFLRK